MRWKALPGEVTAMERLMVEATRSAGMEATVVVREVARAAA